MLDVNAQIELADVLVVFLLNACRAMYAFVLYAMQWQVSSMWFVNLLGVHKHDQIRNIQRQQQRTTALSGTSNAVGRTGPGV